MKILTSILSICLLAGCATKPPNVEINVNAIASARAGALKGQSYILIPGQKGVTTGDLQFEEFSGYVERALATRGLKRASDPSIADLVVQLSYAIGDPQTFQSQITTPVFGQTGISSINTTGQVIGNTFSSRTTATPTYGITGYTNSTRSDTYFTRNARLVAFKREHVIDGSLQEQWKVSLVSTGSSGDLRAIFPYLISAGIPYVGSNPGKSVVVSVPLGDPGVAALTLR